MEPEHSEQLIDFREHLENLRAGIRDAAHEINNPLGVIRMATYFLQTANPEGEKKDHYFKVIEESLGRIEQTLQRLKILRESPISRIHDQPPSDQH